MGRRPIYVEIHVRGVMDELWRLTQTPEAHERWDLRFSEIDYLPRETEQEPQRFRYATRIGFGLRIAGEGESVGESNGPRGRVSALRFWSDDPKSLIREGSGYWKYVPAGERIRFFTRYDYGTRFGMLGRALDRVAFRPLLGWATAWSFDRLRLWIEKGVDPGAALRDSIVHAITRVVLALIWIYGGIVPKLWLREVSGELEVVRSSGLLPGHEETMLTAVAIGEILFGLALLVMWRTRGLLLVNVLALPLLALAALASDRRLFVEVFNPATLNLAMMALASIGWIVSADLPSARRCLRREPGKAS